MKSRSFLVTLLSMTAMLFFSLFTITSTQAQTTPNATNFSGDATGVIANATVGIVVTANATIAPTGALPSTGGRLMNGVDAAETIDLDGLLTANAALTTGIVTTRTSGGVVADGGNANTSQSQAVVNNLDLNILAVTAVNAGLRVQATTITANTACTCGPNCTGSSTIENLRVNGSILGSGVGQLPFTVVSGPVTVDANGNVTASPNSEITVTLLNGSTVNLFLNEQTGSGTGSVTVNALRIQANLGLGINILTTNIIVAQAHSDITCAATATTSADLSTTKDCTINGNTITCTITVTNNGPNPANNVVIRDVLPAETTFFLATGSAGVSLTNPDFGTSGTVTGRLETLLSGQSASITVVSKVSLATPAGTVVTNTATATSDTPDNNQANNTATVNILVGVAPTPTGFNPTFSGRAIGAIANIGGIEFLNGRIADTGPLPSEGGSKTSGATVTAAVALGGVGNAIQTGVFSTSTFGGADGGEFTSRSQATVNNLNLSLLGGSVIVGATTLTANTSCTCGSCTGNSVITDLNITGGAGTTISINGALATTAQLAAVESAAAMGAVAPNTTITVFVAGVERVTVILNEQIIGIHSITVNALRVIVDVNGIVTSDVVIAQAESDLACPAAPTAASVTIKGRVLSPYGRGVSRARVLMTDSTGKLRTALTNPFGYYSFTDVEVGGTYTFEVRDKRYVFTPRALSLTEELANFNFTAQR